MFTDDTTLVELAKLLPQFADIEHVLQPPEVEARYILKRAAKHFEQLEANEDREELGYLVEALVDKSWERIHSGHFSQVPLTTRQIYALGCFYKIFLLLLDNSGVEQRERCSAILDEALLLGCTDNLYGQSNELQSALMKYLDDVEKNKNDPKPLPILEEVQRVVCRCDIPQLDAPCLSEFRACCYDALQPTLLLNTLNHWTALSKWRDLNYLLKMAGNRTVPIEIGSNYASDEWSQQLVKIRDFLYRQFGDTNRTKDLEVEYLAQHELFAQIPALKSDICVPDYCSVNTESTTPVDIKAWLGPKDTVSPMHTDPKHNLLCQVFGSKRIILASPADTANLYAHESEFLGNTSQIDAANLDFERFPLLSSVRFYELILQPGDCLYLPPKWWHYVRSNTPSFSVSFWFE
ncbi:bifunctional peptidase and arginyl-hydroxylase JMJD5 isoform X1 [Drosophila albomicans]|uniref:Bifunctional peptidase and arginyl-hydroxylase JMJD5 isoform X1 n=2 Tax=Drosophila albomicans TaxID=7291 RepID=A0A6P8X7Q6_DROAB|nr:bifunctional peptidase and arginyl-hydroxylase JMJD5 isoform X1 [Drosophila albomicans]